MDTLVPCEERIGKLLSKEIESVIPSRNPHDIWYVDFGSEVISYSSSDSKVMKDNEVTQPLGNDKVNQSTRDH